MPGSEERRGETPARLGHRGVVGGQRLEQAEQMHAGLVAVVAGGLADQPDEPVEGLVDLTAEQFDVGGLDLEGDVGGRSRRAGQHVGGVEVEGGG